MLLHSFDAAILDSLREESVLPVHTEPDGDLMTGTADKTLAAAGLSMGF